MDRTVAECGGVNILVNNAAHQATFKNIEDISDEEWELTFGVTIHAMFYLMSQAQFGRRSFLLPCPSNRLPNSERTPR